MSDIPDTVVALRGPRGGLMFAPASDKRASEAVAAYKITPADDAIIISRRAAEALLSLLDGPGYMLREEMAIEQFYPQGPIATLRAALAKQDTSQ